MRLALIAVSLAAVASAAQNKRQFSLPYESRTTTIDGTIVTEDPLNPGTSSSPVVTRPSPTAVPSDTDTITTPTDSSASSPTGSPSSGSSSDETGGGTTITSTQTEDGGSGGDEPTETDGGSGSEPTDDAAAVPQPLAGAVGLFAAFGVAMAL